MPWVSIADMSRNGRVISETKEQITLIGAKESNVKLLLQGTLLFSFKLSIGKVAFAGRDLYTNEAIAGLPIKNQNELDKEYLFYFLQQLDFSSAQKAVKGGTLNKAKMQDLEILVPPIAEQRKIVEKIEKQFVKIDEAARLRAESQALTEELLPAALHEISSSAESNGWEEKSLGEVCNIQSGGTPSKSVSKYWDDGDIPWLRSEACRDAVVDHAEKFISREGLNNSSARMFKPKTTLIALVGATIGRTGFLMFESTTNQNIAGLYPKNEVELLPEYLFAMARGLYPKFLEIGAGKFKMANLTFVRSLKIHVPSLAEQKRIVKKLDSLSEKVRALRTLQSSQAANLKAIKQSILHKAFSGNM